MCGLVRAGVSHHLTSGCLKELHKLQNLKEINNCAQYGRHLILNISEELFLIFIFLFCNIYSFSQLFYHWCTIIVFVFILILVKVVEICMCFCHFYLFCCFKYVYTFILSFSLFMMVHYMKSLDHCSSHTTWLSGAPLKPGTHCTIYNSPLLLLLVIP